MKKLFIILICIGITSMAVGQDFPKHKVGKKFESEFQKLVSGEFTGSVNGLLIIQDANNVESVFDFQCSNAKLVIQKDPDEVYDVSTKIYKGTTISGKTEVEYKTYAASNAIRIRLSDEWFELSLIDGACMEVIADLDYEYKRDNTKEYLILQTINEFTLSNCTYLIKNEQQMTATKVKDFKPYEKKIKIMPKSVLIFAINRDK